MVNRGPIYKVRYTIDLNILSATSLRRLEFSIRALDGLGVVLVLVASVEWCETEVTMSVSVSPVPVSVGGTVVGTAVGAVAVVD